jgi:hypothetical protein
LQFPAKLIIMLTLLLCNAVRTTSNKDRRTACEPFFEEVSGLVYSIDLVGEVIIEQIYKRCVYARLIGFN